MENRIELRFTNTLTNLAGYDFGLNIYNTQVKGKINLNQPFEIIFPKQIKGVASSFVQGFFENIVEEIGLLQTEKNTRIISEKPGFADMIMKKLQ